MDPETDLFHYAKRGFQKIQDGLVAMVTPTPLQADATALALSRGYGGKKGSLTDVAAILPSQMSKFDGDEQTGPTGAGDVFGGVLLTAMHWGWTPVQAAYLASCAASIVVEELGGGALNRVAEAWTRLPEYGRIHNVDVPPGR